MRTKPSDSFLGAKNEAHREPLVCLQIARAYLTAADPVIRSRTWQTVLDTMADSKEGPMHQRWLIACKDRPFDLIRNLKLVETRAEEFWKVLQRGNRFHQYVPAPDAQLRAGHELTALAGDPEKAVVEISPCGKANRHLRRALPYH